MRHEALLRELWTTHLGVSPEVESDFMRAGGSSLLLMEIQLGIQNRSEIWIDLVINDKVFHFLPPLNIKCVLASEPDLDDLSSSGHSPTDTLFRPPQVFIIL